MSEMLTVNAQRWNKGVEARLPAPLDTGPLPPAEGPRPSFGALPL